MLCHKIKLKYQFIIVYEYNTSINKSALYVLKYISSSADFLSLLKLSEKVVIFCQNQVFSPSRGNGSTDDFSCSMEYLVFCRWLCLEAQCLEVFTLCLALAWKLSYFFISLFFCSAIHVTSSIDSSSLSFSTHGVRDHGSSHSSIFADLLVKDAFFWRNCWLWGLIFGRRIKAFS